MKKRLTKVLSLILTLVMFLSVTTPAFAWGGGDLGSGWDREIGEGDVREFGDYEPAAEEEEEMDLFQTFDEENNIQVTVEAPMGSLPSLAEIHTELVPVEDVREAVNEAVEGEPEILLALDISFWLGKDEIEPEKPVRVKITANELQGRSNLSVVHIPEDAEPETVEMITDENELGFELGANEVAFRADSFSVYAVIGGSANDLKLTVHFFESTEAEEPISTQVLVLEQFDEEDEKPLIDPGVPTLTDTQSFEGWRIVDGPENLDINALNAYIRENYADMTEDQELVVYAMIFEVRYVIYHDQSGAVLRTQAFHVALDGTTALPADVEIELDYVPFKGSQNFAGWVLEEKVEVAGDYPLYADDLGTVYRNKTTYQLSETLKLYPYLNTGNWMVFDTYKDQDDDPTSTSFVAPVFVEEGQNTVAPTPPTRTGYKFMGWYKDKNFTNRFVFGSPINEKITLYAKWTPQEAKYTVVFWQQKNTDTPTTPNADKQYNYYSSVERYAHTGASVSIFTENSGETADNRLAYNSASSIGEMGFYFLYNEANTDTGSKVVNGDGSTVLNVYYDLKVVTYNYYESNQTTLRTSITGLYGAQLKPNDWPSAGSSRVWHNDATNLDYPLALTEFKPVAENSTEMDFYVTSDTGTAKSIYYVAQPIGESEYTEILTSGITYVGSGGGTWYPNETIQGFTVEKYRFGTSGSWTECDASSKISISGGGQALYVAFRRNTHELSFYSNNAEVTPEGLPNGVDLNAVPFGSSFAQFRNAVPTNGREGYYFDGWYADPSCDTPFNFEATMPDNNVRIYAKWTQIRFRVVCDPRGGDTSINVSDITLPNEQASTFRVDYGEVVEGSNLNNATREGYTLLGWYLDTDPNNDTVFDTPFNFATPVTTDATHADMTYGVQGASESDEAYVARRSGTDPWKGDKAYNDQDGEHDDVVGKVIIYARWREDPDGVIGINVRYDAVDGQGTINGSAVIKDDPNIYADQAQAYAQPAAIPNPPQNDDPEMKFLYWDILGNDGQPTGRKAYPGQTWEVLFSDAVEEAIDTTGSEEPNLVTFDTPIQPIIMPGQTGPASPLGEPTRAVATYQRVTAPTAGKFYLIAYVSGSTAYLMGNSYYDTSNSASPKAVSATISNNTITGNFDDYVFGVEENSGYYRFGSLYHMAYLNIYYESGWISSTGYLNYGNSSYGNNPNTYWSYSNGQLVNYNTSIGSSYRYVRFNGNNNNNRRFELSGSGNASQIVFFELVEPEITGETFEVTTSLRVGDRYIIAIDDRAVGNTAVTGDYFIRPIRVTHNTEGTESVTVASADVSAATWEIVSGNAADGFVFKNLENGKYLGMSADGKCYLSPSATPLAWTYDGTDLNNNVTDENNAVGNGSYYFYLSFSSTFNDFTTSAGTGQGVKFYAATNTFTVTFVDGHTNEVIETQEVEEGESAIAPDAPNHTDDGWIFSGWDTAFDNIDQDITVTAQYVDQSSLSYTVTFRYMDANGEWISVSQTVQHGQSAVDPRQDENFPVPPAGYTFNSWDKRFNKVTGPMTVNAVYKQVATKKYVVTLRAVYGRADAGSVTHINWYSNVYDAYGNPIPIAEDETTYVDAVTLFPNGIAEKAASEATFAYEGDPTFGEHGYNLIYDSVEIPESVLIPEKPYGIPGYRFLGWARVADASNLPEGHEASEYLTDPADITPDDVYIRWVEDNANTGEGHYEARNDTNQLSKDYYLIGWINGSDYRGDNYKFNANGTYTVTFPSDTYVFVKNGDGAWFMTDGFGDGTTGTTLYAAVGELRPKEDGGRGDKIFVPGNTEVTFTLIEQGNTLFLSYTQGAPSTEDEVWVPVTYVAANEQKPYHDMYAVWEGSFQIYHSGVPGGAIETVPINFKGTYDLTQHLGGVPTRDGERPNVLYGGYYLEEGITTIPDPVVAEGESEAKIPAYDGSNWVWAEGQTENGTQMHPVGGKIYYIKEVPADKYLRPYFHYTYHVDSNVISSAWLISDTDDTNYQETGFAIVKEHGVSEILVSSLTVRTQNGNNNLKLTAKRVFGAPGYLSYLEVMKAQNVTQNVFGNNSIVQYWLTPDGLYVTSAVARTYSGVTSGNTPRSAVQGTNADAVSQILDDIENYAVS